MSMNLSKYSVGTKKNEFIFVYILKKVDNTYYTGMTNNIARRMEEHEKGESKSTKHKLPVKLMFLFTVRHRENARLMEVQIKNRGAKRWLNETRFRPTKYNLDGLRFIARIVDR